MNMSKKKTLISVLTLVGVILVISLIIIPKTVMARKNIDRVKHITTVKIEEGDTLWEIAKDYITQDYSSMKKYILEIKRTNNLTSDTIHKDCYLIIPYYTNEIDTGREY